MTTCHQKTPVYPCRLTVHRLLSMLIQNIPKRNLHSSQTHFQLQEMTKITSFLSKKLATMKNHVIPSSTPLGINKQKPMKRTTIRKNKHRKHKTKHLMLKKVVPYLISDCYMYNPLVSPQPALDFPPPKQVVTPSGNEEGVALPIKGKNKKLLDKIVDFLEVDSFMYSPLLDNEHVSSGQFQTLRGSKSTEAQGGRAQHIESEAIARGGRDLGGQLRARPVVMKTVAYRESLKHVVHQNHHNKSSQGA